MNKLLVRKPSLKNSDTSSTNSNAVVDGSGGFNFFGGGTKLSNGMRRFSTAVGLQTVAEILSDDNDEDNNDQENERRGKKQRSGGGRGGGTTGVSAISDDDDDEMKKAPTIIVNKYTDKVWVEDEDLVALRHNVNDSFRSLWAIGIDAYIEGNWQKARAIFHETMLLSSNQDGPSKFLITLIDEHGGDAPKDWPGYRADY